MKRITAAIMLLLGLVTISAWQSCQSTKNSTASKFLKFNLQNGKGYDYETTVNMDQEIMGQKVQMDMTTYYSMNVIADSGDVRTITSTIDRFKMKSGAAGFNIEIDTDKPIKTDGSGKDSALQMINKLFGAIRNQRFTMKVNAEGRIIDVTGFETMAEAIVDSIGIGDEEKETMKAQFNKQFNGDQVKSQLERFWNVFPNKEVKVGDTWSRESKLGGTMPGSYNSTYKVKDIEGDMVTLEEKTKVDTKEDKMNLKGDIEGTLVVDSRSGLVVSADQDMTMKADAGGMSFEIKGKTKTKGTAR